MENRAEGQPAGKVYWNNELVGVYRVLPYPENRILIDVDPGVSAIKLVQDAALREMSFDLLPTEFDS